MYGYGKRVLVIFLPKTDYKKIVLLYSSNEFFSYVDINRRGVWAVSQKRDHLFEMKIRRLILVLGPLHYKVGFTVQTNNAFNNKHCFLAKNRLLQYRNYIPL